VGALLRSDFYVMAEAMTRKDCGGAASLRALVRLRD
jgi:hypothetical protein